MILALVLLAAAPQVTLSAPSMLVSGAPFVAHVEFVAPAGGASLPSWALGAAAFTVDGKPLAAGQGSAKIELLAGQKLVNELDLSELISKSKPTNGAKFKLGLASELGSAPAVDVSYRELAVAEAGLDFMKLPAEELSKYHVYMQTNRGDMEMEFWPDVAPGHVRNFLDLCYTHFYDGKTFHRVIPGFMIQGGDPKGDGTGDGPRPLKAEFSDRKHVRGVLSMARQGTPNTPGPQDPLKDTASCQFFVMAATAPSLDGNYSAFGKVVTGLEVIDKIVNTRRGANDKPFEPQVIQKAIVFKAPAK